MGAKPGLGGGRKVDSDHIPYLNGTGFLLKNG